MKRMLLNLCLGGKLEQELAGLGELVVINQQQLKPRWSLLPKLGLIIVISNTGGS